MKKIYFLALLLIGLSKFSVAEFTNKNNGIGFIENGKETILFTEKENEFGSTVYYLQSSSPDNKWAFIGEMTGGPELSTEEISHLYYRPYNMYIKDGYSGKPFQKFKTGGRGIYFETNKNEKVYLSDLELEISKKKYLLVNSCDGIYKDYNECGIYYDTNTRENVLRLSSKKQEYVLNNNLDSDTQVIISPPTLFFNLDGKNFWHYSTNTIYNIKNSDQYPSLSHFDKEIAEDAIGNIIKLFSYILEAKSNVSKRDWLGSYSIGEISNNYRIYFYKQNNENRFCLLLNNKPKILGWAKKINEEFRFTIDKKYSGISGVTIPVDFSEISITENKSTTTHRLSRNMINMGFTDY